MASLRQFFRDGVDRWFPAWGQFYRDYRDERAASTPIDTPFGFKIAVPPTAMVGEWFAGQLRSGAYETDEIALLTALIDDAEAFIDIGANIGWYVCLAATRGKRVLAFEPLPSNLRFLLRNLAYNGLEQVELYPLALGAEPRMMKMYGGGPSASFFSGWHGASAARFTLVPVTTLDTIAGRRFAGVRLAIKLDVEGFEYEVLRGATATLDLDPKPSWLVENHLSPKFTGIVNERFLDVFELFWEHGYEAHTGDAERRPISPDDVRRWASKGAVDMGSINYLFTPRASHD
jgi:FkbM family methyltransferase